MRPRRSPRAAPASPPSLGRRLGSSKALSSLGSSYLRETHIRGNPLVVEARFSVVHRRALAHGSARNERRRRRARDRRPAPRAHCTAHRPSSFPVATKRRRGSISGTEIDPGRVLGSAEFLHVEALSLGAPLLVANLCIERSQQPQSPQRSRSRRVPSRSLVCSSARRRPRSRLRSTLISQSMG